ncbi:MAG TPA: CDP-alcohol phosphatidyltransferase family protein [Roseiflexaceae bacterium]|nr:CDP-alcohol phosphatidyltransferase family protein [Roseiflexaceae bacterium]
MMPILARFRGLYEQTTIPLGKICLRLGLTPDMLTITSLIAGGLAAYVTARGAFWLGIALILVMALFDMLDGATARAGGTASPFGTVFDHVVDRYAEFLILLGVMMSGAVAPAWAMFALFGMIMASYVRARAESTGLVPSCNVGFAGRQEKLAILMLGMALQPLYPHLALLEWAVIGVGVASHITALQRLLYTRRILQRRGDGSSTRGDRR